jgi:hypothetical protein
MQNKFTLLKAKLLDIAEQAEDEFDMNNEDDASDASAEYAHVLEQIAQAYEDAGFDVEGILE